MHIVKQFFILVFLLLLKTQILTAQNPEREFRGIWIATVSNIDFPSKPGLSEEEFKKEYAAIIHQLKELHFNAVIFQIRPAADAFYASEISPWSAFLTGMQGKEPGWEIDPLKYLISTTHKAGMEFHAWFNPFRAAINDKIKLSKSHVALKNPEWVVNYNSTPVLNPGIPDVREHICKVIEEVLRNYDIDAIHFDDYFYPYPIQNLVFEDEKSFREYGKGWKDKENWRRNNINELILLVHNTIKTTNPKVKFGISPFGIWRNNIEDTLYGSPSRGLSAYDAIFADSRKWLNKGWVDYLIPQIYWSRKSAVASFDSLTLWWSRNSFGRHIYIGHALYKIDSDEDQAWMSLQEMPDQIRFIRSNENLLGSSFFSYNTLRENKGGIRDSLKQNLFTKPALIPSMNWIDSLSPSPPITLSLQELNSKKLTWLLPDDDDIQYVALYKAVINDGLPGNYELEMISGKEVNHFTDSANENGLYAITTIDKSFNQSDPVYDPRVKSEPEIDFIVLKDSLSEMWSKATISSYNENDVIVFESLPFSLYQESVRFFHNSNIRIESYQFKRVENQPIADSLQKFYDCRKRNQQLMDLFHDSVLAMEKTVQVLKKDFLQHYKSADQKAEKTITLIDHLSDKLFHYELQLLQWNKKIDELKILVAKYNEKVDVLKNNDPEFAYRLIVKIKNPLRIKDTLRVRFDFTGVAASQIVQGKYFSDKNHVDFYRNMKIRNNVLPQNNQYSLRYYPYDYVNKKALFIDTQKKLAREKYCNLGKHHLPYHEDIHIPLSPLKLETVEKFYYHTKDTTVYQVLSFSQGAFNIPENLSVHFNNKYFKSISFFQALDSNYILKVKPSENIKIFKKNHKIFSFLLPGQYYSFEIQNMSGINNLLIEDTIPWNIGTNQIDVSDTVRYRKIDDKILFIIDKPTDYFRYKLKKKERRK